MFGNISQLMNLMRNAGQIRENMKNLQDRLSAARYVGEAGGGQVRATVDGKAELVELKIAPELIAGGDTELIEDLLLAGIRDAVARSREGARKEMEQLTGGMDLDNVMKMLGGGQG